VSDPVATPLARTLPDDRTWWRVADTAWADPLDPTWADRTGGRWNTPGDGPTLYLSADVDTARAQVARMLRGTAVDPEDRREDAPFVLLEVALPRRQRAADAVTDVGLASLGLPRSYPRRARGGEVPWSDCRRAARRVRAAHLRGVHARSAAHDEGTELAWFPAATARAALVSPPRAFAEWRHASTG